MEFLFCVDAFFTFDLLMSTVLSFQQRSEIFGCHGPSPQKR